MLSPSYVTLENSTLKLQDLLEQIEAVIDNGVTTLKAKGSVLLANSDGLYKGGLRYNSSTSKLQYTQDGVTWINITSDSYQWDSSKSYALGDIVIYSTGWYSCVEAGTTDVPGSGDGWALLTAGSIIRYVDSADKLAKALADGVTNIVVVASIPGSITGTTTKAVTVIHSDESTTIQGNISITCPSTGSVYWHCSGTRFTGSSITVVGGKLYIERLAAGTVTLTGSVIYQRIDGAVTGGTQDNWNCLSNAAYLKADISGLDAASWTTTGKLYVYDSAPKQMLLDSIAEEAGSRAAGYQQINKSGTLAQRPTTADAGYRYYATDTGDLYTMLHTGVWSNALHVQGKQGKIAVPSLTADGVLTWALSSEESPTLPSSLTIKGNNGADGTDGANGCTYIPTVDLNGLISWTMTQTTPTTIPVSRNITGPIGYTYVPSVSTSGLLTWAKVQSSSPPSVEGISIKGPQGDKGDKGDTGAQGEAGSSPVVTFTAHTESGYRTMNVSVGETTTTTDIYDGAQGVAGPAGADGADAFVYIRYASDNQGSDFSMDPADNLKYIGILNTDTEILNPQPSHFTGLWTKYIADTVTLSDTAPVALAATAAAGTGTTAARYDHVHPTTGLVTEPTTAGTENQLVAKAASGYKFVDQVTWATLSGAPTLATVATSGKYTDLTETPDLADVATTGDYDDLSNKPTFATVATTGAYGDLSGKPSIYDSKITVKQGDTVKGAFTLNQSGDYTLQLDAGGSGGSVAFADITGNATDNSSLSTALAEKMSTPASGAEGQVLTKTSDGFAWQDAAASGDMKESVYVATGGTGRVLYAIQADKLATARAIGNASFDGTSDIDLDDIGAASSSDLSAHSSDSTVHVTSTERTTWNAKASQADFEDHAANGVVHITASERTSWDAKANQADFESHTANSTIHVTAAERTSWDAKLAASNTGTEGQYLEKTSSGCRWADITCDAITNFTTSRTWTADDMGKLFRYTGSTMQTSASPYYAVNAVYYIDYISSTYTAVPVTVGGSTYIQTSGSGTVYIDPGYTYRMSLAYTATLTTHHTANTDAGYSVLYIYPGTYSLDCSAFSVVGELKASVLNKCLVIWGGDKPTLFVLDNMVSAAGSLQTVQTASEAYFYPVPGVAYTWAPTAETAYLMQTNAVAGKFGSCDIDIIAGTCSFDFVFSGTATLIGTITENKTNHCKLWFRGATAYLQVLFAD